MSVRREAGKVWIEGVPALGEPGLKVPWLARTSQTCTFASALEAALSLTERPYSYEQVDARYAPPGEADSGAVFGARARCRRGDA